MFSTTDKLYNVKGVDMAAQFYVGQVVEPEDLFFREGFIRELWDALEKQHVILTAPRRTGKTSVMTHLLQKPEEGWLVLFLNVQDTSHPADFYLQLLDELNTRDATMLRSIYQQGKSFVDGVLHEIDSIGFASFKVTLREKDTELWTRWKDRLDDLMERIRKEDRRVLVILDELPDMLLAMKDGNHDVLREFLGWFRKHRMTPIPSNDNVRWLIGGSINLLATLDSIGLVDRMNDPAVVPLPVFTDDEVAEFVTTMLEAHGCSFDADVPQAVAEHLGRPIPFFMQMATQELYRIWRKAKRNLEEEDVVEVFNRLVTSPEARDKLQHYHSRIAHYYEESMEPAYALLGILSLSEEGVTRKLLLQKFDELRFVAGIECPAHEASRAFNEILLHLENDFYIVETADGIYDFASGILKLWWRKYYA